MAKQTATGKTLVTFLIDSRVRLLLERIKERDGVPYTGQIERGIVMFAKSKGFILDQAQGALFEPPVVGRKRRKSAA
jgi:hypothetical protein